MATESERLLKKKILEMTVLYDVSHVLGSTLDFRSAANQVLGLLAQKLEMRRGTITLLEENTKNLLIEAAHGLSREEIERGKYRIGEGVTGKVVERGEPMIIPDVGKEPLFLNRTRARDLKRENISFLCVPIKVKGETLGVLSVDHLFSQGALEEDVRVLTVVASLLGQSLKIHRMIEAEKEDLIAQKRELATELKGRYRLDNMVGISKPMVEVFKFVERVAPTRSTVMIRGESGTGKELVARAIHFNSPRSEAPFIKVSCAALPETLLESELFGHEKGSYTGATEMVKGRFELADGGTLFLDEIGDVSAAIQVKLLRVLQERKFERVGGTKTLSVDVRVLCATNRNLEEAIAQGRFREDLYYRLNVVPIFLPPLRDRSGDIPPLLQHFLEKYNRGNQASFRFSPEAVARLSAYPWPGNVRELENTVERMCVMAKGETLGVEDVPLPLALNAVRSAAESPRSSGSRGGGSLALEGTLDEMERKRVLEAMERCGWVQARACKVLGITPRQLGYKLKKFKIPYKPTNM